MGDWLHCNTCFKQPGDGRGYFLTNCGHIYCEVCKDKGWLNRCLLCETENPTSIQLTSKLKPPYDTYMTDPLFLMKQIDNVMKQLIMATDFQQRHRRRFVCWLQKCVANQGQILEQQKELQISKLKKHYEELRRENSRLREESIYLRRVMSEKRYETKIRGPIMYENKGQYSPASYQNVANNSNSRPYNYHTGYHQGSNSVKTMVTSGRISLRTPPSGGRLGVIPQGTPSPISRFVHTPKSVPHPIDLNDSMRTPSYITE